MNELIRSLTWGFGLTLGHAVAKLVIFVGVVVFFVLLVRWFVK